MDVQCKSCLLILLSLLIRRKHSDGDFRSQRSETPLKKQRTEEKSKKIKSKKSQNDYPTPSDAVKVKGDAPDRFWASVEPYCADITDNDIKLLQEGLKNVRFNYTIQF